MLKGMCSCIYFWDYLKSCTKEHSSQLMRSVQPANTLTDRGTRELWGLVGGYAKKTM